MRSTAGGALSTVTGWEEGPVFSSEHRASSMLQSCCFVSHPGCLPRVALCTKSEICQCWGMDDFPQVTRANSAWQGISLDRHRSPDIPAESRQAWGPCCIPAPIPNSYHSQIAAPCGACESSSKSAGYVPDQRSSYCVHKNMRNMRQE